MKLQINKGDITINNSDNKMLIYINGGFNMMLTLENLAQILVRLCEYEDEKGKSPKYKGRFMLKQFFDEAMYEKRVDKELLEKFHLPYDEDEIQKVVYIPPKNKEILFDD